ncbi:dehydrogenase [Sphaerosporella brunnea]|uniref:Dehydrogenase n=1 Tax=Sphaerosporella brunnea TaxID=1250544 RepID=A0A5J5F4J7_9PEZI|nr:dehydrogenase [Sphaerosporella brunnea]
MHLNSLAACQEFEETQDAAAIAAQLRKDRDLGRNDRGGIPSLLFYCIPASRVDDIARALCGEAKLPISVARMRYHNIVGEIKTHLADMNSEPVSTIPAHMIPSEPDFKAALKVFQYLQLLEVTGVTSETPLRELVSAVQAQLDGGPEMRRTEREMQTLRIKPGKKQRQKKCYICRYVLTCAHPLYPSLCMPCGDFNVAESALSLPENLSLPMKTAVVTGGRINLGFHTALRLLRCGAKVVVSTRYPFDAETRYLQEPDSEAWKARLRVVGADFRSANDVFALVGAIKNCLQDWGTEKLDILVNNAAQTLTDPMEKESHAIRREQSLEEAPSNGNLLVNSNYTPRVRAGQYKAIGAGTAQKHIQNGNATEKLVHDGALSEITAVVESKKSSWTQKVQEIPYEDVISAYSVNSFVPLILLRELLPLMSRSRNDSTMPAGYIINVSSREALPEHKPGHSAKAGYHVHTNMSKAALNMLTETESADAWRKYRVAVNSVDPGYMSADPMWAKNNGLEDDICPIGWEDGAGRVLWVVAKGESGCNMWGRFLKHFDSVEAGRFRPAS